MARIHTILVAACVGISVSPWGCGSDSGTDAGDALFNEFVVTAPSNTPGDSHPGPWPDDIDGDADGNVWFAMHHADEFGRMSPTGVYTGFPIPTANAEMDSVAVADARGIVWVSEVMGNKIGVLVAGSSTIREFTIPTKNSYPEDIRIIAGRVVFSERYGSRIGEISVPGLTD